MMMQDQGAFINRNDKGKTSVLSNKDIAFLIKKHVKTGCLIDAIRVPTVNKGGFVHLDPGARASQEALEIFPALLRLNEWLNVKGRE